jgi:hypothetical protein
MASKKLLREKLFYFHLADLKSVVPGIGDVFICPICLKRFFVEDIYNRNLTDGHVWPEDIRKKSVSKIANLQRVLLCQYCNTTAGSRGDKQMQLREKIKEGEETGELHGERRVQIIQSPGEKPIELRARVVAPPDTPEGRIKGQLTFEADRKSGRWPRNDPKEQERFLILVKRGGKCSRILVFPSREFKPTLAPVGWITASYLLAFYTLGYRYILHESLNPVREYIRSSFEDRAKERLEFSGSDTLSIRTSNKFHNNPEIGSVIPIDGKPFRLEVKFLDTYVTLPFHCALPALLDMIYTDVPDIEEIIPKLIETGGFLYIPVDCNRSDGHDCDWDYILGKPIPEL